MEHERDQDRMTDQEKEQLKSRLLLTMTQHVGKHRIVGMGELFERVFQEPYANRINDTKRLRKIVTELRNEGVPICSSASRFGGGYYLASAGSELADYLQKDIHRALKILRMVSRMKKVSLAELWGQLPLDLEVLN